MGCEFWMRGREYGMGMWVEGMAGLLWFGVYGVQRQLKQFFDERWWAKVFSSSSMKVE